MTPAQQIASLLINQYAPAVDKQQVHPSFNTHFIAECVKIEQSYPSWGFLGGSRKLLQESLKSGQHPRGIFLRTLKAWLELPDLEDTCRKVVQENPKEVQKYRDGKDAVLKFLCGKVMGLQKGLADPEEVVVLVSAIAMNDWKTNG
jgi:Asp-tRNA(Asn)/Glu-tRNA(Gln) amidotransferase B subunit